MLAFIREKDIKIHLNLIEDECSKTCFNDITYKVGLQSFYRKCDAMVFLILSKLTNSKLVTNYMLQNGEILSVYDIKNKIGIYCGNVINNIDEIKIIYINPLLPFEEMKKQINSSIKRDEDTNYCTICGIDLGECNPRQYCEKTFCPYELF